jgi:hypothetical protein
MLAAVLLLAAAPVPAPTTVNGQVLGTSEEYTTAGPARVCLENVVVTALPGESVSLGYSGIHDGRIRLNRGSSWVELSMSQIWIPPKEVGEVLDRRADFYIADISDTSNIRYGLFGPDRYNDKLHYLVRIDGPTFSGDPSDRGILRRIDLMREGSPPCQVTYNFGWDVLMGDRPMAIRHKKKPQ